ncbi:beta-galactosidase trimerization domain-containing protein [bacterium]|nr:beta-galactosidase trimerization domain-containing protein [bacterium]
MNKWFQKDFRRNLVDMHIENWDESFLSQLEPRRYVELLKTAKVSTAMVYANSHVGYCYWPTRTGKMHRGIRGKDVLGELIELCHREGMNVVVYYSLIYNNWAYDKEPAWRMRLADGREARAWTGRYGVCCPNSGYRDFAFQQVEELLVNYDFEGIFFDMTFWPIVCYCQSCRERFFKETGKEPPKIIDWENPEWVLFQRKREEWLSEFAKVMTEKVKKLKPNVTVEHQFSTCVANWVLGVTENIANASDYCGGDFYGGALQESFICKLYYNLTANQPFEFMTSRCINLNDHTTTKQKELLEAQTFSAIANGGAFLFIDAIDPIGTMNEKVYETMGEIFSNVKDYEEYIGGELCQDVAIYFSFESKWDPQDNKKEVLQTSGRQPHLDSALNTTKSLITNHIPFGIITKNKLEELNKFKTIVLPYLLMVDEEEAEAFREYVFRGGKLYASYRAFLLDKNGKKGDFLLSDVLGISFLGETKERVTYISPSQELPDLFEDITTKAPLTLFHSQILAQPLKGAEVIARICLPYTDPADVSRFASIHSNPPGIMTDYPAIVRNKFGKGEAIWCAGPLEMMSEERHRSFFLRLLKSLVGEELSFQAEAPKSVEITMFKQKGRYIINLLNFQPELPNIPVQGIKLKIKITDERISSVSILPSRRPLPFQIMDGFFEIEIPRLETFMMISLEFY